MAVGSANGEPPPAWLRFDPHLRIFCAERVPPQGLSIEVAITVRGKRTSITLETIGASALPSSAGLPSR